MNFNRSWLAALCLLAATLFAAPAFAGSFFSLDSYRGAGTPPAGPYGSVLLTQDGANVDVLVTLAAAEGFAQTTADVNAFDFDLNGIGNITVTDISHGFTLLSANTNNNVGKLVQTAAAQSLSANAAGLFNYAIKCTVCSAQAFAMVPLSFTVDDVTIADFIQNASGNYFSANLCLGKSHGTCIAEGEATAEFDPPAGVPEPASIAVFGAGLFSLGASAALYRRRKAKGG